MGQISSKLRTWGNPENGEEGVIFFCPGCKSPHTIRTRGNGAAWGWNGNADRPTFTPSVLVTWQEPEALGDRERLNQQIEDRRAGRIDKIPQAERCCHSFVTDGLIQFLGDSTHELAGQTVELADWPEGWE